MMRIPITKPWFDEKDFEAVRGPLETGWVVQGPKVAEFEQKFAAYTGADAAVACSSCTSGLHLALAALGIGPGDEAVVPAFTWVATANVVEYCGARPVFCDIDLDTFNAAPAAMAAAVTPRTKALLPVHLFGLAADMAPILDLATDRGLRVVEDAACGLGATWRGTHVGRLGDFGAFSFHPRKAVSTGEGGMVLARDPDDVPQLRTLRDHGASKSDRARHEGKAAFLLSEFAVLGYNYRLTDIQGALGCTQMDKAAAVVEARRMRAARYDAAVSELGWLRPPPAPDEFGHAYQSYVCLFAPEIPTLATLEALHTRRNALMMRLEERGISTRQGTHAVTNLAYYRDKYRIEPVDYPNALMAEMLSLTLPLYPQMTEEEQSYVLEQLRACFE